MIKKIIVLIIAIAALVAIGVLLREKLAERQRFPGPHLFVSPQEYDFGKVLQSQKPVFTFFEVKNDGSEEIIISGVPTSCGCTSAEIDKTILKPGEATRLKVIFDPNFHEEPEGRFFRTAAIKSEQLKESPEVKVWMEVEYDLGKDKLKFGKDED